MPLGESSTTSSTRCAPSTAAPASMSGTPPGTPRTSSSPTISPPSGRPKPSPTTPHCERAWAAQVSPEHQGSRSSSVSDTPQPRRSGRGVPRRSSPAALGLVHVDPDFAEEYPDGDASSTEAYASLVRTGTALLQELHRCMSASFDLPQSAATALAVIDGAGEALTPTQISERVLIASATMTSTLDLLERRGWIFRTSNPQHPRSVLVAITTQGRATADRLLAGVRTVEAKTLTALTPVGRQELLALLAKVLGSATAVAAAAPTPLDGRRNRPARLAVRGIQETR